MRTFGRIKENFGADSISITQSEYEQIEASLDEISIYGNRTDEDIAKLQNMK